MSKNVTEEVISDTPGIGENLNAANDALKASEITETDILNFALNLAYLEADFYTYASTGKSITSFGIAVDGLATGTNPSFGGSTVGGALVKFDHKDLLVKEIAFEIGVEQRAHVALLRSALGSAAVAKPNINLNALGIGFGNQSDFLAVARLLEDIGVSGYSASAAMLKTPRIITMAARLLAAEAQHAGSIRTQLAYLKIPTGSLDGVDILSPPSGKTPQFLSTKPANGLTSARDFGEVLFLTFGMKAGVTAGGFFPNGVNGFIKTSSGAVTASSLS